MATQVRICVIAAILVASISPSAYAKSGEYLRSNPKFLQPFRDVVKQAAASVVRVQSDGNDVCLGIIVHADGWILTKAHDLQGKVTCKLGEGKPIEAKIVGVHEPHDLALLKVGIGSLRPLTFASSFNIKAGTWVASVGTGPEPTAVGIVSVPTRKVSEAYLGVQTDGSPQGLVVLNVVQKSAAFEAGLRPKDIILHINGRRMNDADDLQDFLGGFKPGDTLTIKARRGSKDVDLQATLRSREQTGNFRSEFQNRLGSDLSNRRSGYATILQLDSVLKPGDCGSPLVDLQGHVVGVNISRAGRVETWAIPGEIVPALIADLKTGKFAPKTP